MVSIITPVYNNQFVLVECIESVLNQSFKKWELILIDDFSSDNSRQIIKNYSALDERIIYFFFDKNVGAGLARNKGIDIAKNRFIAFLDSDDYWHVDKLKYQIEFMIKSNLGFSFTRYYQLDKFDKPTSIVLSPAKVNRRKLLFNNYIKTLTAIYDTDITGKVYMPDYRKRQDWGLWFNILSITKEAYCFNKPLAYYRTSNSSLSKNKILLFKENLNFYRFYLKKNVAVSFFMMVIFLIVHFRFKFLYHKSV